jgi:hypothetical protein
MGGIAVVARNTILTKGVMDGDWRRVSVLFLAIFYGSADQGQLFDFIQQPLWLGRRAWADSCWEDRATMPAKMPLVLGFLGLSGSQAASSEQAP